jgi:tRNA/tmRNA/rRNA uracil-C5-methylase (TrmA/RlmC/RlmD family)
VTALGQEVELTVGPVAHGGHCVARHEGRVVFVRHALPGERVRAVVTDGHYGSTFWRADTVEVLEPSADRVVPPCPWAGPGRCGGCDLQHASLPAQRALKTAVVREQLARLAGLDVDVEVEPVPGDDQGLGWRTRVQWAVGDDGRAGQRRHP